MESINVGIHLSDKDFARALARGLARECRKMNFYLMNGAEAAADFDLILSENPSGEKEIHLVSDLEEECFDDGKVFSVFKYRDSFSLVNYLVLAYFRISGKVLMHREHRKTKLVVFTSAAGGCGTTSLSLAVCHSLRRLYGTKCLYLNLCPVNDAGKYLKMDAGEHLLKLLYALNQERELFPEMYITREEDFDYIGTGLFNTYFDQMQPAVLHKFLDQLEKSGVYDILLCDIGNYMCRGNKDVLAAADCAVFVSREDFHLPNAYLAQITREIEHRSGGTVIPVINCSDSSWEENGTGTAIHISTDADAFGVTEDGLCRILFTRNYGTETSVIAKKIIEEEGEMDFERNSKRNI